jgi:hypothetical protein
MITQENKRIIIIRDDVVGIPQFAAKMHFTQSNQKSGKIRLPVWFPDYLRNLLLKRFILLSGFLNIHQFSDPLDIS